MVAEAWPGSPMTLRGHNTGGIRAHHCGDTTTTTELITATAMPQAAHHWELGDHGALARLRRGQREGRCERHDREDPERDEREARGESRTRPGESAIEAMSEEDEDSES